MPVVADRGAERERELVAAARAGDEQAFAGLTAPHRRELHVHCYRLLGSFADAEDALQESLLRAWRGLDRFDGRGPFRAWLYRIATNVCLTALARRREPRRESTLEPLRLEPYPDVLLEELPDDAPGPEARYERREAVELAFVAALQALPPRQRAVLALRDVLGYTAAETAALLDASAASVNGLLVRARAALERERRRGTIGEPHAPTAPEHERALVRRFVEAWEAGDVDRVVELLTEDALLVMPPERIRLAGRGEIGAFLSTQPAGGRLDRIRLVETRANGRPALAAYVLDDEDGLHHAYGLMALALSGDGVTAIVGFPDPACFPRFDLPPTL